MVKICRCICDVDNYTHTYKVGDTYDYFVFMGKYYVNQKLSIYFNYTKFNKYFVDIAEHRDNQIERILDEEIL